METSPNNHIYKTIYLLLLITAFLLLLYFLPVSFLDALHLKPMDILSDIRKENPVNPEVTDTLSTVAPVVPQPPMQLSGCPENKICLEDFSPEHNGMDAFFAAIDSGQAVRIAFFGDSFIEGDIFCGDLREELQEKYGGTGVGMMPLSSPVSAFRRTIIHQYKGWKDYCLTDTFRTPPLGISGHLFVPQEDAWAYYSLPKEHAASDSCGKVSLFYKLKALSGSVYYTINGKGFESQPLEASGEIERLDILRNNIRNIRISFPDTTGLSVYGVSLEDTTGIILDNFSIRGTAGTSMGRMKASLPRFDQLMGYDLIILEYGLNMMEAEKTGYKKYEEDMAEIIRYLQTCFPNASFLLLSVSDRSMKKDGELVTMPAVPAMVALQKRVCAQTGIVFWNLFEAMGGKGSMVEWANSTPPKANKDYTHLTFAGGKYMAKLLFEAIEFENKRYNEKKDYLEKVHPNGVDLPVPTDSAVGAGDQ